MGSRGDTGAALARLRQMRSGFNANQLKEASERWTRCRESWRDEREHATCARALEVLASRAAEGVRAKGAPSRGGPVRAEVAAVLRGKNNPSFTPHLDTGDFVVVVNADKIKVSGKKPQQKLYRRHSGRPGGMKVETFQALQERIPERIVEKAIKGMLPHNALGRQMFRKLKVYKGNEHPHAAQQPQPLQLNPSASAK